ncbi:MAG: serine hydrolase [Steroidobacteraceae bacterium]
MRGIKCVLLLSALFGLAACGGGGGGDSPPPPAASPAPPATNAAPTVNAGADATTALPNATVSLAGSAMDDGPVASLVYQWSANPAAGVTFSADKAAATDATFTTAGTYTLTLTAGDGTLAGSDTVTVTVSDAPTPALVWPATDDETEFHGWAKVEANTVGMTQQGLTDAGNFAQVVPTGGTGGTPDGGNGMIVRHGQLVHFWGDIDEKLDVKSVTKSMGGVVLGLAIKENKVALDRKGIEFIPTFGTPPAANATGAQTITLAQLATHTAGFQKIDRTVNGEFTAVLEFTPGTTWSYSDAGLNWLADVLTTVNQQDLAAVAQDKVWSVLGVNPGGNTDDISWRAAALRPPTRPSTGTLQYRELASGIQANVNAMARVGLLFLRKGKWKDAEILTTQFVTDVQTPRPENAGLELNETAPHFLFPGARTDYGLLWWTNKSGLMANVPKDAFWAWGLGEALIVVIPSLDLVIARNGGQSGAGATAPADRVWNDEQWDGNVKVLEPFLNPIVAATTP